MTEVDQDCLSFSTKTDIVSSLQLDKKIKCRCYISQFTLNDEVLVSVERREHYNVTEKMITIEVDVCVGIYDYGRSNNNEDVPRLRDMDREESWVSKITNYDCFVDKDISMWVRDDVMENNKLYLVKHKHNRNEEQSVCHPRKSTLRTTGSQFNPPGDNQLNKLPPLANNSLNDPFQSNKDMYPPQKKEVMRNELYVHRGEPEVTHVDTMFTSYIDIDLNNNEPNETLEDIPLTTTSHEQSELPLDPSKSPDTNRHTSYYDINLKNDPNYFMNCPLKNNQLIKDDKEYGPKETLEKERSTKEDTKDIKESDKPLNNNENSSNVKKSSEISREDIPFAEDSEDDLLNIKKGTKTVSKYLQYYLPIDKNKEERYSEFGSELGESTGVESNTDSTDDYLENGLVEGKPKIITASFDDEISDRSKEDACEDAEVHEDPYKFLKPFDDVDFKNNSNDDLESQHQLLNTYDESIDYMDVKCQENMVLQTNQRSFPNIISLDLQECRKENVKVPKSKKNAPQLQKEPPILNERYQYLPVSLRKLQFEVPEHFVVESIKLPNNKPLKVKLITSENYTDMVEIERLNKEENSYLENKDQDNDKESSISYSSGSMIVKDVASDENIEFFITHNNIEKLFQDTSDYDDNNYNVNVLDHVEEESDGEYSSSSLKILSPKEHSEQYEDELEPSQSQTEIDATEASSFTGSTNIDNVSLRILAKTPIEKSSGKFMKFLEERERQMSIVSKSSLSVSRENSPTSSYITNKHLQQQFVDDKQNKVEEFINHDPKVLEELQDKSSTLTSISSSTSLQYEDIHNENQLEISRRSKFEDNITLLEIKKKEYSLEQKEDASSNLSSYSTSSSKEEEIKYVILPLQKAAEDDILKESEGSSTSSEWSFSENQEKRDSLNIELATLKTIPFKDDKNIDFKLASKKLDQFLIKKQKRKPVENEESSGTEDSSTSSSSSHYQGVQDKIILRHGESIEDIEELLNRQRPSFTLQVSTPLRKQFSLPNINKRLDPTHANNRSVDHREKLEYQEKKETIKSRKNQNDLISKNYSSGRSTISSSSEEEESDEENKILMNANMEQCEERDSRSSNENHHENKSIDHRERFEKGKENKKFKAVPKSNKDDADDVISSSEEEKSDEEENEILMKANMEQCEERDLSSSDENHHENKSIDHRERFEKGFVKKQIKTFIKSKSFENQQPKIPNENKEKKEDRSDTDSTHSSHSHTISTSSDEELKNAEKKFTNNQNMLKIPNITIKNNTEKNISNLSTSSATSSSSSHIDSKHRKHASSDHREKFENEKKSEKLKKPNKGYTSKSSSEERSSSSSHTISSSSDEESKYGKKVEMKSTKKLTTPHNSSDSSNTIASSSNEESNFPMFSSIDHREKFENKEIDKKIRFNQQKSSILKDSDNDSYSSNSLSYEDLTHSGEISVEKKDKFEYAKNNEIKLKPKTSIDSTKNLPNSSGENSHFQQKISIDRREKFKEEDRNSKIQKQISSYDEKMAPENSSEGSNTLSSSSDEEYANIKAVSIDRQEKFESQNKIGKIKKPLTSQKAHDICSVNSSDEDSVDLDDHSDDGIRKGSSEKLIDSKIIEDKRSPYLTSSSHTSSSSSEENNNLLQNVNKNALRNNPKVFNGNGKKLTYSSSVTISSSSDDESHKLKNKSKTKENNENEEIQSLSSMTNYKESNTLINKSADRREDFEDSINPLLLKQEKSELLSDHSLNSKSTTSTKDDEESKKSKSIDHREKFDNLKMNNKIKNVSKGQFQNNSSSPNTPQEHINQSNSTKIENLSSSSSISFSSSDEDNEKDEKRKIQTLPMKKSDNNISLKERSKSLQKSVNIEETFAKDSNFGGSTIDMVERKYNEYTETWTRQSPIDKKLFKPKSQPNLEKIHNNRDLYVKLPNGNNKYPIKKPFKKGPRPIPSYLSPVNAFPHEPSDKEFESNDSLVNDYSSEYNAEEIKPRCGSLPDFIQELSSNKLFKAPFQKPSARQKMFKLTKPLKPSKFIELNYGAEDDFVDNSKDVIRRASSVSVTTDSSYLEKPILAEKSLKSNLAKLDSMSSSLSSSTVHISTKSKEKKFKASNPVESRSSSSLSSLTSNSESELIEPPVKNEPQRSMNQMYQDKSKIINKSSPYPIKSNNFNRQKIPSSSESSEYSSTSDEETASSKDILKK